MAEVEGQRTESYAPSLTRTMGDWNCRVHLVRLLGDMHAGNWVVDITPDFEKLHFRMRAIDFDQQTSAPAKCSSLRTFGTGSASWS